MISDSPKSPLEPTFQDGLGPSTQSESRGKKPKVWGDVAVLLVFAQISFFIVYLDGAGNAPNEVGFTSFVWRVGGGSFWVQYAFSTMVLPGLYFVYTMPSYFVRPMLGKILRILMYSVLVSFSHFLLDSKVAYVKPTQEGFILIRNNGERLEISSGQSEIIGESFKYYEFSGTNDVLHTFGFFPSELPLLGAR